jgi:hypothetical protein
MTVCSSPASPSRATTAVGAGFGPVHLEFSPVHRFAVQGADGFLGGLLCGHFHKAKAPRSAGVAVGDDLGRCDLAELGEQLAQGFIPGIVTQIANIDIGGHVNLLPTQHGYVGCLQAFATLLDSKLDALPFFQVSIPLATDC